MQAYRQLLETCAGLSPQLLMYGPKKLYKCLQFVWHLVKARRLRRRAPPTRRARGPRALSLAATAIPLGKGILGDQLRVKGTEAFNYSNTP